jgi:xanthine dehydrogenase YagS FAD-binding subunit
MMQRPRCTYFRDVTAACNRREPGTGCGAREGFNRNHAILGTSDQCVATHPSDAAVAFAALEATVHLLGPEGERTVAFTDFVLRPGSTPQREQDIRPGELITAVEIPSHPRPLRSGYLKVRDRQSYEFALISAAVALHVRGGVIRAAKVAAGGVGTVPWKLPAVEQRLIGRRPSEDLWAQAAEVAADGARPLAHNGFKVELLKRTVERQLRVVGGTR